MPRTYIATPASRKLISDAKKTHAKGKKVDWDKVFAKVNKVKAHSVDEAIKAINAGKRKKK